MIIEKIIGKLSQNPSKPVEAVEYEWYEADRKRLKKTGSLGSEIGLMLTEPLFDGAVLFESCDRIIALSLAPCETIRVKIESAEQMGQVCYELGNRHLPIEIEETYVKAPYDEPTLEYLRKLGFGCERSIEKFAPKALARAHRHE